MLQLQLQSDSKRQCYSTSGGRRHHDGAGLGLAIVREIVDLHHGDVRAGPGEGGKGLCVEIALPLLAQD